MTFLTPSQLSQLGRSCSLCDARAKWLDKLDENSPAYCDKHFPGKICQCEYCKEHDLKLTKEDAEALLNGLKFPPPINDKLKQALQDYYERKEDEKLR